MSSSLSHFRPPAFSLPRELGRMHPQNALGRKYFGQSGEDFLVWSLFSGDEPGFFVDVGSFDGIHLSNSYSFELAGWDGICVEAHPEYFPHLKKIGPEAEPYGLPASNRVRVRK